MQGRSDLPLNETGTLQAQNGAKCTEDVRFDAVYASPLQRAIKTAAIIGNIDPNEVIIDPRIIETDFGPYEERSYFFMGIKMTLYWALPELFPAPRGVETVASMRRRSAEFLSELEEKEYENVLVVCHGGIIRALCGYLEDRKNGIKWRPKPHNCEIRIYESKNGKHQLTEIRNRT